jgi:hypothetical protein
VGFEATIAVFERVKTVYAFDSAATVIGQLILYNQDILDEQNQEEKYDMWLTLYIYIILSGVRMSPLGTAATTGLLYQTQMIADGDCRATGGVKIGMGNRSTQRKPSPAPLCPPQIPHNQNRARTRAAAVGSQRLTA